MAHTAHGTTAQISLQLAYFVDYDFILEFVSHFIFIFSLLLFAVFDVEIRLEAYRMTPQDATAQKTQLELQRQTASSPSVIP